MSRPFFQTIGDVEIVQDEAITRDHVKDAAALIIRSKTPVTSELIADTALQFVGTATAGYDHVDVAAVEALGVEWCSAAGCNANSVAEYITAALLWYAARSGTELTGKSIAVIGVGHVGSAVVTKAKALGMRVLPVDPPRQQLEHLPHFKTMQDALAEADVVTLHVPLTDAGSYATRRMADTSFFERVKPGAVFINAARGEVVNEESLLLAVESGVVSHMMLDVWDHEPNCNAALLSRAAVATPHIAGYSIEGKFKGTQMIYRALCEYVEISPHRIELEQQPRNRVLPLEETVGLNRDEKLHTLVRYAYDIEADSRILKNLQHEAETPAAFTRYRKNYPERHEFSSYCVAAPASPGSLRSVAEALGFKTG